MEHRTRGHQSDAQSPLSRFCARLKDLQHTAGFSQTSLAAAVHLSTSQMSDILSGKIKRPPDWDVVHKVVRACLAHAKEEDKSLPVHLRDERDWRRRFHDLEQDFDPAARPRRRNQAATGGPTKTVGQCDPLDLEVHRVLLPPGTVSLTDDLEIVTPYLKRHHDSELRAALSPVVAGGSSVFAVLAGDSCTGKTRALYEALHEATPDWPILRPADIDELLELLHEGRFQPGTVLWLNDTQRYLYGTPGERAATLLRRALLASDGAVAVGALWSRPYLEELTAPGNSPDVHAAARALLDSPRTHLITVPNCLTGHEQQEMATLAATDKRLEAAMSASGPDGDVIQHLTGGPELLSAYTRGGPFTPVEHALITAALDARRLGHQGPIPAALLAAAADGYLSPRQRPGQADWAASALTGLAAGTRPDGTRTSIRNALTALTAVRARSGDTEAGYEPDDYLDQHTRRPRQDCLGPRQLWDALAEHAIGPDDLHDLGQAAYWSAPASLEALMSANWCPVYQTPVLYSRFPRTFSAAYRRCKNGYAPRYTSAPSLPWRPSHHQPLANRHEDR
jgi:transcriptional regulator with XRE-family HTH domain